jgi:hypothetical protein
VEVAARAMRHRHLRCHPRRRGVLAVEAHVRDGRPSVGAGQRRGMPGQRPRGKVAGEPASAVLLMVAGAGSAVDLAPGEPRRRLLLVWMRGLVAVGRWDGRVGGGCSGDQMRQRQWVCPGSIWASGAVEAAGPRRLHPCVVSAGVARGLATAWPSLCSRLWVLGGSRTTVVPGSWSGDSRRWCRLAGVCFFGCKDGDEAGGGEVVHCGRSDVLAEGLSELTRVKTCSWLMAKPAMVVLRAPSPS